MGFPRRDLTAAVKARLEAIGNLTVYVSEVPATPPTISDDDLRVAKYVVLHPGSGVPLLEESQCDDVELGIEWGFQVTCASGIADDIPTLVDKVSTQLQHWRPIASPACGRCKQISNFDNVLKDRAETPTRYFLPLIYRVPLGA